MDERAFNALTVTKKWHQSAHPQRRDPMTKDNGA